MRLIRGIVGKAILNNSSLLCRNFNPPSFLGSVKGVIKLLEVEEAQSAVLVDCQILLCAFIQFISDRARVLFKRFYRRHAWQRVGKRNGKLFRFKLHKVTLFGGLEANSDLIDQFRSLHIERICNGRVNHELSGFPDIKVAVFRNGSLILGLNGIGGASLILVGRVRLVHHRRRNREGEGIHALRVGSYKSLIQILFAFDLLYLSLIRNLDLNVHLADRCIAAQLNIGVVFLLDLHSDRVVAGIPDLAAFAPGAAIHRILHRAVLRSGKCCRIMLFPIIDAHIICGRNAVDGRGVDRQLMGSRRIAVVFISLDRRGDRGRAVTGNRHNAVFADRRHRLVTGGIAYRQPIRISKLVGCAKHAALQGFDRACRSRGKAQRFIRLTHADRETCGRGGKSLIIAVGVHRNAVAAHLCDNGRRRLDLVEHIA